MSDERQPLALEKRIGVRVRATTTSFDFKCSRSFGRWAPGRHLDRSSLGGEDRAFTGRGVMDVHHWKPALVMSNRFEAQIMVDLLRNAGVPKISVLADLGYALVEAISCRANILIVAIDGASDSLEWVRELRRDTSHPSRKAPVFMISSALTLGLAERCRQAGANAIIGKPVSTATLLNTIKKVLAKPRPFVEGANYVGPCRRAGIVTAGAGARRRKADVATCG